MREKEREKEKKGAHPYFKPYTLNFRTNGIDTGTFHDNPITYIALLMGITIN